MSRALLMYTLVSQGFVWFSNILLWKTSNTEKLKEPHVYLHLDSLVNILQHLLSLSLCRQTHSSLSRTIWELVADIKTLHLEIFQHVSPKKKGVSLHNPNTTMMAGVMPSYTICTRIPVLVCEIILLTLMVFLSRTHSRSFHWICLLSSSVSISGIVLYLAFKIFCLPWH